MIEKGRPLRLEMDWGGGKLKKWEVNVGVDNSYNAVKEGVVSRRR